MPTWRLLLRPILVAIIGPPGKLIVQITSSEKLIQYVRQPHQISDMLTNFKMIFLANLKTLMTYLQSAKTIMVLLQKNSKVMKDYVQKG